MCGKIERFMETNTKTLLEWHAASRPDYVRSEKWYVVAGAFCAIMIAYGIFSDAWSLSLIFAFVPGLYYVLRNQNHKKHHVIVRDVGIVFDGRLTAWGELKEFWILQGPGYYELHIAPLRSMKSDIVVMTGDIDPYVVRDTIGQFLPQIAHRKERLLDAIIRFCKL